MNETELVNTPKPKRRGPPVYYTHPKLPTQDNV